MSDAERTKPNGAGRVPSGWWTRRCLRAEPWPLLIADLLLSIAYCSWYTAPQVAMVALNYYEDFCYGVVVFGAIAAARGAQLYFARRRATGLGLSLHEVMSRRRFWPWFGAVVALTVVVLRQELPLSAGFFVSQQGLDAIADEALADPAGAHRLAGRRAGCYRVAGVEVIGETVVLYLDRPEGQFGFARVPGAQTDRVFNVPRVPDLPDHHPAFPPFEADRGNGFTDPVGRRIAGDWFVVYSSYWHAKVGWS